MIKNIYTNAELTHPPTTVTMPDGSVTSGAGPEQVYAAGWREVVPFIVPDGMQVIEGTRTAAFDESHDQWTEGYDTETPEEAEARLTGIQDAQAQLAQTRVLGLTDAYGADVAILGRLLAGFGYALPCDPAEVLASIKGGLATGAVDWDLRTDADTLEQRYEALKRVMTDADIAAVGAVLLGAQQ